MNEELRSFVRDALGRGLPRSALRERLREAGWRPEEVEAALGAFAETDFPVPVPRRRPYVSAREAFLYLVLFATLYISAFNTGIVLFAVLDRRLPDVAQEPFAVRAATDALRNGIAGLVIAFPIFLWVATLIGRTVAREAERRGSRIRRWLTYVTLFVTALVLIGDLTFLVQRLLSGELPVRVLLKVLVVFAIAGTIFGHYLLELRSEEREEAGATARRAPWLARAAVVAVLATLALGLATTDSPRRARLRALDARRVGQLRVLASELEDEAAAGRGLPATLDELMGRGTAKRTKSIRDPQTGAVYGYTVLDSARFRLCANFALEDSLAGEGGEPAGFWRHPAGRTCYTVDVRSRGAMPRRAPPGPGPESAAPGD